MSPKKPLSFLSSLMKDRLGFIALVLFVLLGFVILRLAYLQIIKHDYYLQKAQADRIVKLVIPADRGVIYVYDGDEPVALAFNQNRWILYTDPFFLKNKLTDLEYRAVRDNLITGLRDKGIELSAQQIEALDSDRRYLVLKKGLTSQERDALQATGPPGLFFQKYTTRQYSDSIAAHVLGFLNADGQGQYGVEKSYDDILTGIPGKQQFLRSEQGVPLVFNENNLKIDPQSGQDIYLTLDRRLQFFVEERLAAHVQSTLAEGGTAIVMDAETGAIRAMANYPSYDLLDLPTSDPQAAVDIFNNKAVSAQLEPGSVVKALTMSIGLEEDVVDVEGTFYNRNVVVVDGLAIRNSILDNHGQVPVKNILPRSLNTGVVEVLKRLGGEEQVNLQSRQIFHDYMSNSFRLGQPTGIDLPGEINGQLPNVDHKYAPNHLFATMTFGQSLTMTPIQIAAAYGAIFNGGTYYQPYVVDRVGQEKRQPVVLAEQVISEETHDEIRELFRNYASRVWQKLQYDGLETSAKTGTANIASPDGGYLDDKYTNSLMAAYMKSEDRTLVIVVVLEKPLKLPFDYTGRSRSAPLFREIVHQVVKLGLMPR